MVNIRVWSALQILVHVSSSVCVASCHSTCVYEELCCVSVHASSCQSLELMGGIISVLKYCSDRHIIMRYIEGGEMGGGGEGMVEGGRGGKGGYREGGRGEWEGMV